MYINHSLNNKFVVFLIYCSFFYNFDNPVFMHSSYHFKVVPTNTL